MSFKKQTVQLILVLAWGLTVDPVNADYVFGTPTKVPNVNSSSDDVCPEVSADGLSLFIGSKRPGGYGGFDLWVSTRATAAEDWDTPVNLGPGVNSSAGEHEQSISHDGLELYFSDYGGVRAGGVGNVDTWVMTRAATDAPWGEPVNLGPPVNSSAWDGAPSISGDGLSLFFHSGRTGNLDLWVATRETVDDEWGTAVNLGLPVNSSGLDADPDISADGLRLFFASNRGGGYGGVDLWMAERASPSDPWETPINLGPTINGPLNGYHHVSDPAISPDGRTLYFGSGAWPENSTFDLWQVAISPILDFNGDGNIDRDDLAELFAYWGTDDYRCDIGPMPWGDGIVDIQDLMVLAEYIPAIRRPSVHAQDMPREVVLSWIGHPQAETFDIYLGTSWEDVSNADRGNPLNVLVSLAQDANSYDPGGLLDFDETYYWRIDEVHGEPGFGISRGVVWGFTTESFSHPIENVSATASSSFAENMGPEKTLDGSGLDFMDRHSARESDMWLSDGAGPQPSWIQYAFDQAYALHELWVWNSNQLIESFMGLGARDVLIEYSLDAETWTILADVSEFAQAPGTNDYLYNTVVDFGGAQAQYVRITITSNWGGIASSSGLSEVRFFRLNQ